MGREHVKKTRKHVESKAALHFTQQERQQNKIKIISRNRPGNGGTVGRVNMIMLLVGLTIGAVIGFGVAALLRGGE